MERQFGHGARMTILALFPVVMAPATTSAETIAAAPVSGADTAWVLVSAALVLAMTVPGLALFWRAGAQQKRARYDHAQLRDSLRHQPFWVLLGYSLAFGPDVKGVIGNLAWAGLSGVGLSPHAVYGPTIPHQAFMVFQLMFAAITPPSLPARSQSG